MSAKDTAKEVLRHELKASEELESLMSNNEWDEVDSALLEVASELIERADDEQRSKTILIILFRVGRAIESESVVRFSKEHLEEWKQKYE